MIGFKCSLKKIFTIKKYTSIEKKSFYNKSEYFMLKTISYSIVFVSKIENNVIVSNLFDDINSTRTLRKDVIEKVFPNENITIENKGNSINVSQYITSNGFKMTFEKPLRMMIECNCNGDDKKEEYINLIAQKIIDIIKEERKNNINGLISSKEFNYNYKEKNNCISYKANLDIKITDNINICDLLKEKQKEFIVDTISNLYGEKDKNS